jgi:hypothetical protein
MAAVSSRPRATGCCSNFRASSTRCAAHWQCKPQWPGATPGRATTAGCCCASASIWAIVEDEDIFGDGVNIAARLQEVAEPGGICLSQAVHDNVRGRIDAKFEEGGAKSLKNTAEPVRVYRIQTGERTPAKPSLPLPEKPSLAVLPFQNLTSDPEQEYFADGIVEEITTAIARLPWLFVIARNSSFTYKGHGRGCEGRGGCIRSALCVGRFGTPRR